MLRLGLVLLSACGRIAFDSSDSFDPLADGGSGADSSDAAMIDLAPWGTPTLVALPTTGVDDEPTLTRDLLQLYFVRGVGAIYVSTRATLSDPWSAPILDTVLDSPAAENGPQISGDGQTMYLSSNGGGTYDILRASRATPTGPWTGRELVPELSDEVGDDYTASANGAGTIMITSSTRASLDLFEQTRTSSLAPWSFPPTPIPALSTTAQESRPFLTKDGLTLYYVIGFTDLYVTHRARVTDPFPAGALISELHSGTSETAAWVSEDGRYMMFASTRSGTFRLWEASR